MATMGETDYRSGAKERLSEAFILLRQERFGGSVYLAGRAVEGMLRALIWSSDHEYVTGRKSLDTGHDLRDMLKLVRSLGAFGDPSFCESITADVQKVARLWSNNMRFWPERKIKNEWYNLAEIDGKRTMKQAAKDYYDACSVVVKRCEDLWRS